jgi:hypothetical protein
VAWAHRPALVTIKANTTHKAFMRSPPFSK